MTKTIIILVGVIVLAVTIAFVVARRQAPSGAAPDVDQQVIDVTRNLHPTKLNP